MTHKSQPRVPVLARQSQCLLALVLLPVGTAVLVECAFFMRTLPLLPVCAVGFGALLAALVWKFRAATPGGAVTGGLITAAFYLAAPGWRTALWPLIALLLLTLTATRFGRTRKENLGVAEDRHGRTASQVAANLGIAALAAVALRLSSTLIAPHIFSADSMRLALAAALAEAAADTLSSEFGEVLGGEPRLITNLRTVPAGTDGAISFAGTMAGFIGAAAVVAAAAFAFRFTLLQTVIVMAAAVAGLFIDSLFGAVFERRGWINNDAVNFLSTLFAALFASLFASGLNAPCGIFTEILTTFLGIPYAVITLIGV